jgi:hypothetical protein
MKNLRWLAEPEAHDYVAAQSFLELTVAPSQAKLLVQLLREAPISEFKAKDILRASRLPALQSDNKHVSKDLKKINDEVELSPILMVRGNGLVGTPLVIADGYHRVCAIEEYGEDLLIHCKIADLS